MMRTAVFSFPFTLKNIQLSSSSSSSSSSSYSCHYLNSFNFDRPPPGLCLTQKLLRPQLHHFKVLTPVGKSIRCSSTTNNSQGASAADDHFFHQTQDFNQQRQGGFWNKWKENSAEMSAKLAKLGLAAVLAYGLFDGFTYTSFFVLAFLGYEKSTGKNPATNLQALLGIVIMMWAGNNVTRPFRVTGAAALAPFVDQSLRRIQKYFNFPNLVYAFALVVALVAGSCFTVIGLLILSRWGK